MNRQEYLEALGMDEEAGDGISPSSVPSPVEPLVLRAVLRGPPVPQGSKRAFRNRYTGRIQMVESNAAALRAYRELLGLAMRDATSRDLSFPIWPAGTPVAVRLEFRFLRPASHFGSGRNVRQIRARAPAAPAVRPDGEKLARAVADAGTGIWWQDDAQIVEWQILKCYAGESGTTVEAQEWAQP